ncbi:MAG: hypothetical protein AB7O92_30930 [Acidimicrobiia bacterium]
MVELDPSDLDRRRQPEHAGRGHRLQRDRRQPSRPLRISSMCRQDRLQRTRGFDSGMLIQVGHVLSQLLRPSRRG